jgi:hypothetical protein
MHSHQTTSCLFLVKQRFVTELTIFQVRDIGKFKSIGQIWVESGTGLQTHFHYELYEPIDPLLRRLEKGLPILAEYILFQFEHTHQEARNLGKKASHQNSQD